MPVPSQQLHVQTTLLQQQCHHQKSQVSMACMLEESLGIPSLLASTACAHCPQLHSKRPLHTVPAALTSNSVLTAHPGNTIQAAWYHLHGQVTCPQQYQTTYTSCITIYCIMQAVTGGHSSNVNEDNSSRHAENAWLSRVLLTGVNHSGELVCQSHESQQGMQLVQHELSLAEGRQRHTLCDRVLSMPKGGKSSRHQKQC